MSLVLDWFFGENHHFDREPHWLTEGAKIDRDAAPILKLNWAIVHQAISDRADRIDYWIGIPDLEYPSVETLACYERGLADENPVTEEDLARTSTRKKFRQIMADAGVGNLSCDEPVLAEEKLTVIFTFNKFARVAMTIPVNLIDPIVRAYPYYFNFRLCLTTARPENLLVVSSKNGSAFASIDHYDRVGEHKLGICLEYEE